MKNINILFSMVTLKQITYYMLYVIDDQFFC